MLEEVETRRHSEAEDAVMDELVAFHSHQNSSIDRQRIQTQQAVNDFLSAVDDLIELDLPFLGAFYCQYTTLCIT